MIRLSRTVRFCINSAPVDAAPADPDATGRFNTFAAWPSMRGLGRYYEIDIECEGEVDPATGYFINIKDIDEAVRQAALPIVGRAVAEEPGREPWHWIATLHVAVDRALSGVVRRLTWRLTPFYSVSFRKPREPKAMAECLVRQQFEFAASHRLHCEHLSDEENRRVFGKCNHPHGHGHNYRLEVAVAVEVEPSRDAKRGSGFDLQALERVVSRTVIDRFDHKYLNRDNPEFAAINPSVENIAKVCHDLLKPALAAEAMPLREVTVWETDKTACTYPV